MNRYKKIGIIGGMGPETTVAFYQEIIRFFQKERGARHNFEFPEMLVHNVPSPDNVEVGVDDELRDYLVRSACILQDAGMDFIVIPCNSAHVHIDAVIEAVGIPVLNILQESAKAISAGGVSGVLLLGTKSTLNYGLYNGYMERAGIPYTIPDEADRDEITRVIMHVCDGSVNQEVRDRLEAVIARYPSADGVVLGCTELPLVLGPDDIDQEVFNTSLILARATFDYCVS